MSSTMPGFLRPNLIPATRSSGAGRVFALVTLEPLDGDEVRSQSVIKASAR